MLLRIAPLVFLLVLTSAGCSGDEKTVVDGDIDCLTEFTWTEEGSVPPGTPGFADPELAVVDYLTPFQANHGGELQMVGEFLGSLVIDGEEAVVAIAADAPGGGWLVFTGFGCEGFDRQ